MNSQAKPKLTDSETVNQAELIAMVLTNLDQSAHI